MARPEKNNIDYRALLKKYMRVVEDNEGVSFLHESEWSSEEWRIVKEVHDEVAREWEEEL